jgi:hypothetical protein
MAEMESDNSMSFTFTQGEVPCQIPEKFLAHYGPVCILLPTPIDLLRQYSLMLPSAHVRLATLSQEPHLQFIARRGMLRHACRDHTVYQLPVFQIVLTKRD